MIICQNIEKICNKGKPSEFKALRGINLKIKNGEFVAIMGASGSGKSTLLHIMGCLDKPTKGKVIIDGIDTSTMKPKELASLRNKKIGFVFQFFFLFPTLNALENVMLPMIFNKKIKNRRERAMELLKEVGMSRFWNHYPMELSGGQRQRIAIARALANDPDVLLADEPTGNLDSKSGKEIMKLLTKLNKKEGKTIVLITHDRKIASYAKRTIFIKDGKIVGGR